MTTRTPARPGRRLRAAGLVGALLVALAPLGARADEAPLVLDAGHVDAFNVHVADGELRLDLKEDVTGQHVQHDPADVELHVKSQALTDVPEGVPGAPKAYWLPMAQDQQLLWPGWDTLGIQGSGFDDAVDLTFVDVDGPGTVGLFGQGSFGGVEPLLAGDALELTPGAVRHQAFPAHTHAHWTFSEPGVYRLQVTATATKDGEQHTTEPQTWTFTVGDEFRGKGDQPGDAPAPEPDPTTPTADPTPAPEPAPEPTTEAPTQPGAPTSTPADEVRDTGEEPATVDEASEEPTADAGDAPSSAPAVTRKAPKKLAAPRACVARTTTRPATTAEIAAAKAPARSADKAGGSAQGRTTVAANTHVHPNWVFSAPGDYALTIRQSTKSKAGAPMSATATLRFHVGGQASGATSGHFDFGAQVRDGKLVAMVKDDRKSPATWIDPSSTTFVLGDAAKATAPAGIEFVAPKGQQVWMIASSQVAGVPWLGANTMHESLLANTTGEVTFELVEATGPGKVGVFTSGNFGQVVGERWFQSNPGGATPAKPAAPAKAAAKAGAAKVVTEGGKQVVKEVTWTRDDGTPCTPKAGMPRTGVAQAPTRLDGGATTAIVVGALLTGLVTVRPREARR
ncbi:choice-of-anchor M domain-containing protein [uncultured Tessaracoccus sp.]|uniref:choice-of-anchor M domain-containing protein n=1 Tax=uncultured Tessaracoccus sp. TaxID=905023 RepID=UPI0025D7A6F8|nr:choice-of-anchor M domain-containing protein [uncultured Tessaracoccus sp.]